MTKVFAAAYQSECRPGGPYGAFFASRRSGRLNRPRSATERVSARRAVRSARTKAFAAAYQSECRPGGPYGALGKTHHYAGRSHQISKALATAATVMAAAQRSQAGRALRPGRLSRAIVGCASAIVRPWRA